MMDSLHEDQRVGATRWFSFPVGIPAKPNAESGMIPNGGSATSAPNKDSLLRINRADGISQHRAI
jgi:hypothetical protein